MTNKTDGWDLIVDGPDGTVRSVRVTHMDSDLWLKICAYVKEHENDVGECNKGEQ
jgi:hypothetical protein